MLHLGLDLSRRRIDVCVLGDAGELVGAFAMPSDQDGLYGLTRRLAVFDEPLRGVVESMTGARFVHDQLVRWGWEVLVADAAKVKALAPLACKTDKIDARVLARLSVLDLVPAIWLPSERLRGERELSRYRMHLVKHRTSLKNRIHATLFTFGCQREMADLFGTAGRQLLRRLEIPDPWSSNLTASLELIDDLERRVDQIERELRHAGADHPYVPLLLTIPGVGWVLAYTIASEIGDIHRFDSPQKLVGYTGLCPRVKQSGNTDLRGPLSKHGPRYLRWALIEAAQRAARHPAYHERYQTTKRRLGKQRGAKVAQIDLARRLAEAIWHMLTRNQPFAPAGASKRLAA